ncbi:translation initiation factor IF-3 [Fusobacterium pseudoperiodonticum]|uniref:Translation initiation factor IF-3 n=1 Tax=Fusobacterium pseudoperiodonticum TaxID=2663009 RepID=A0A2G9EDR1_9FUSO|nr:translation initiation factor IF-3 [Fusobacterium pseudoperiodonticum]ATV63174.1 translation initiation factor IF-3 [Fusobacterium pseudoperiodonticum]ATV66382.1 translation initiation factor IF-3 [Fusobacterium pseudoperiodonticum]ATV67781.1 translation initiation factor IF-3 [Fusobacterium pseudoperiodonticum]ATV72257.1 translation initiation factor IF-3 [Fusobacterium pseudoperiodonticum]
MFYVVFRTGFCLFYFFQWRCSVISDKTRINEKIRGKEFRIISFDGEQLGIMSAEQALNLASSQGYDLVEIAPGANPPVCKVMDYSKYKYEQTRKLKEAKKNQKQVVVKEIKVTARIDSHDLETKLNQVNKFLEKENKVKITLVLFGREKMHANLGVTTLDEIAEKFAETAEVEKKYADKQKHLILSPKKAK